MKICSRQQKVKVKVDSRSESKRWKESNADLPVQENFDILKE